ncbi:diguanylate kinase [Oscillatoriales cyanobacterium USR001]|nr:diguanylate kinase [Oscillatoriales cyanobacterium USR001]
MLKNNSPMYLPTLEQVIDRSPPMVTPDTSLIEVVTLMGQSRSSCPLEQAVETTMNSKTGLIYSPDLGPPLIGQFKASCVFVMEKTSPGASGYSRLKGIFTERDIVQMIARGQNLTGATVAEVMSQPVITLTASKAQDVFTALILLRQHQIRHLPILDINGQLIGVVTPESIRKAMLQPANILKMRTVAEVMASDVIQAPANASVLALAKLMAENHVSCVVIVKEEKPGEPEKLARSPEPIGMVTERDIVQFQALELDLSQIEAAMVMSTPLFSLSPNDSLWVAHQEMQQRYVRRLVVSGSQGELLGILTQTNLLRVLDPMEMSGIIDALHLAVEERTSELKNAITSLSLANVQLESEMAIRSRAEEQLRLLESCVVSANDAIVIMDKGFLDPSDPKIVYINEAFTLMTGYLPKEIIGKTPNCLRGPATDPTQIAKIRRAFVEQKALRIELINYRQDGSTYWVELNSVPITNEQGILTHWVSIQRDVTERKQMEQALFKEKELAQVTLQSIGDGVITTNAGDLISSLNPMAEKLTGWSTTEAKGLPLCKVLKIVNEITREPLENITQIALWEDRIVDEANNGILIARSGREFAIDHSVAPIHASDGQIIGAVVVFRDVTQVRTQARQLSWQATHDALTGLVNRREFEYQLEQAIMAAKNLNEHHILLYLDLDRFKIVNDTCGHGAGDELLRQVSQLFKSKIRKTDMLARLGGDEFATLLYHCPLECGLQIAESLLRCTQTFRFAWEGKTFSIGVSIGLVVVNIDSTSTSCVLTAADIACYAAKDKGRNRVQVYQAGDRELARQRGETQWAVQINQALEENWFSLYSQPIMSLSNPNDRHKHCEILLRLRDRSGQIISPMAFIPAAERYNLMHAIDRWVISTLFSYLHADPNFRLQTKECLNSQKWIREEETEEENSSLNPSPYPKTSSSALRCPNFQSLYTVNLSGASINEDRFIDFLHEQFAVYMVPPDAICFEITETLAIANLGKAVKFIEKLKELGCWFALDDFGSGMSSFAYLKSLPVDFLKIDGNFVKNIVESQIDLAMVEAINRIGHVMGIKTIAEYVENEAVMAKLKELGVDYAQGYYLGMPEPFNLIVSPSEGEIVGEFPGRVLTFEEKLAS